MARTKFNYNQVTLVGRVGSVTLRGQESKVLSLSIATEHAKGGRDNREYVTDWHNVSVFGNAEEMANRIAKGDTVTVIGEIQYSKGPGEGAVTYTNIIADTVIPASRPRGETAASNEGWE